MTSSCDAPRTERRVGSGRANDLIYGNPTYNNNYNNFNENSNNDFSDKGNDENQLMIPSDAKHCTWSTSINAPYSYRHPHLSPDEQNSYEGGYTICQSTSNETDIYLQLKNPIMNHQLCLIPTHHSGNNSVYIGEPRCLYVKANNVIYKISLIKNRTGYTSYPVTGVMMMRDKAYEYGAPFYQVILSPDAYIFCSQWLAQYGDSSYCIPFKAAGNYVYHQF